MQAICFHKLMQGNDYGLFIQRMRKSRGLTQEDLADQSGVSAVTIRKLESSGDTIVMRPNNLDAILTVLAQKAPLGASEIKALSEATERLFESFESLNQEADRRNRNAAIISGSGMGAEHSVEDRINHAVHLLLAAGMGETVMVTLEAMAKLHGEQIADEQRGDTRRRFQVLHPERQIDGYTVQDITHYAVEDDDSEPRELRPMDKAQPHRRNQADSKPNNNTGS